VSKRHRGHREWAAIFSRKGKPHTTYNPGTGQMEPEDYTLYQRQAPSTAGLSDREQVKIRRRKTPLNLLKPIDFTPKQMQEMYVRAGQQFGEAPRKSSTGKPYYTSGSRKEVLKRIDRIRAARERKLQQRLAKSKRKGTMRLPQDTDVELPTPKNLRIERTPITSVAETIKYDPQEVVLSKGGSTRPTIVATRGGSALKTFSGKSTNPTQLTRVSDSGNIRYRWADIIKARKEGGFRILGKPEMRRGFSTSASKPIISPAPVRIGKADQVEKIRLAKEKQTEKLRKQARKQYAGKLRQDLKKLRRERDTLRRRAADRERKRVKQARMMPRKIERKNRWNKFMSRIGSLVDKLGRTHPKPTKRSTSQLGDWYGRNS